MTDATLLFRQVNPAWIQQGHVTSQAFKPTPKDKDQLSVYDGGLISAERSWKHFTNVLHFLSAGVLVVSVQECKGQDLPVISDPVPYPEHVAINFSGLSNSVRERKAKILRAAAVTRGWQYQADGAM